jgi:hypothetical protein
MGKVNIHKQWLNIVIITISALILALTLLGRFIGQGVDKAERSEERRVSNLQANEHRDSETNNALKMIDFGHYQLFQDNQKWLSTPDDFVSSKVIAETLESWRLVLEQSLQDESDLVIANKMTGKMVLIYFSNTEQPIVIKIESALKNGQTGVLLSFVALDQYVWLPQFSLQQLIPDV